MSLFQFLATAPPPAERALSIDDVARTMRAGGYVLRQTMTGEREEIPGDFVGMVYGALLANPIISGALRLRMEVFSQARFKYRRLFDVPGRDRIYGSPDLTVLENPEPMANTGDLLSRALMDADIAGNWFALRRAGPRIRRLRPDWCYLVFGSPNRDATPAWDPDAEVIGLIYQPGGRFSSEPPQSFAVGEFAHWAPLPHPLANRIGTSWLLPLLRDVEGDQQMTVHKLMFLVNGATPNLLIKFPATTSKDKAQEWIELFEQEHAGAFNAYRTAYLGAGMEVDAIGKDFEQIDFAAVQGKGETRMAVAARVPPVLLYISEGLQGSALNAGNYQTSRRAFADTHLRHLWASVSSALEALVPTPTDSELWYDEASIPFLQDDAKDASEIRSNDAQTMRTLVDGGYDPASVPQYVKTGDPTVLRHTGSLSVQLQEPGAAPPPAPAAATALAGEVAVRCTGTRKDGSLCDAMLGTRPGPDPVGFKRKCDRCGAIALV